jgi:RNA polymerase sigma-70 factor, ECF subfamily
VTDSEIDLIKRAQANDTDAFCALAECHLRRIYVLAFHYCHNNPDAEDLSQEVWLKAYQALRTYRFDSSFYTWLRRITINTFLNHQRSSSLRRPATQVTQLSQIDEEISHFTSEETIYNRVLFENVVSALTELTPAQRLMFLLRHYEGMSYDEIATAMNCSSGTAKKAVWRALGKLRAKLEVGDESSDEGIARLAAEC